MDSITFPIAHAVAFLVQFIFIASIGYDIACLYKAKRLKNYLQPQIVLGYLLTLTGNLVYLFLIWNLSKLDSATQLQGLKVFGLGVALLAMGLSFHIRASKSKLIGY